jgi:peptidyl-prolyl cis-trans isomerase SurA
MSTSSLVGSGTTNRSNARGARWHAGGASLRCGAVASAAFWAALALPAAAAPLSAPGQVVLIVNGEPITNLDIEQRGKLVQLTLRRTAPRQELIDDLINDKIKISVGRRYRLDITEDDVDKAFVEMGGRMRMTRQAFEQVLTQNGVDPGAMKEHIKAEISWATIVQGKFGSRLHVNDKDIRQALETKQDSTQESNDAKNDKDKEKDAKPADPSAAPAGYEYVLRPILFVVGRGAGAEATEARKKEAEALRTRFENCGTGIPAARALRDVVVREQIIKASTDLTPAIRDILDKVPVGQLTTPEVTSRGVEVFALCAKREAKLESAAKGEMKNKLYSEKFEAQGKRYLAELRKAAMIEYREPPEPVKEQKTKPAPKSPHVSNAKSPSVKTQ